MKNSLFLIKRFVQYIGNVSPKGCKFGLQGQLSF